MLHIYPQYCEHDDLEIVGEMEDLKMLRDCLNGLIDNNTRLGIIEHLFNSDGEGYRVIVETKSEEEMMKEEPYYRYKETL